MPNPIGLSFKLEILIHHVLKFKNLDIQKNVLKNGDLNLPKYKDK